MAKSLDLRDADLLVRDLQKFRKSALPYAMRDALNTSAFMARRTWITVMRKEFTMRNTFTTRGVLVERARGSDPNRMVSVVGSVRDYMEKQEKGGNKRASGKSGVAIPTTAAAGQARGSTRKRMVRRANYLSAIKVPARAGLTRAQRNAISVKQAVRSGRKVVFLELQRRKGLFRVSGTKRPRITMLWDMTRRVVRTPKNSTLETTLEQVQPLLPLVHFQALLKQCQRHKILGY